MAAPDDLTRRLARHLEEHPELVPRGSRVLVALSGGPDSTALLHLLLELADERGLELAAAHFDHAGREGSGREAERVRSRARDAGVPCRVAGPVRPLPDDQDAYRRARYAFLREAARQEGAGRIATGHHADDQAETVLFRILRGTGLRGLRGIPARRGPVVRPLLPFRRDEIGAWVEARGLPHLRDPSNRDPRWSRGRIRTRVLPALEEAWDGPVRARLLELSRHAGRADRALDGHARRLLERAVEGRGGAWGREAFRLRREPVADADPETRARAVRILARRLDARLTRGGTRAAVEFIIDGRSGGRVDVGEGLVLAREFDRLWLGRPEEPAPDGELSISGPDAGRETVWIGGRERAVRWRTEPGPDAATEASGPGGVDRPPAGPTGREPPRGEAGRATDPARSHRVRLPARRLPYPLTVRGWRDGDRIRTASGTRKLKRVFNDRRVPLSRRARIPTIVTASGRTVWVAGLVRDPEAAPEPEEECLVIDVDDA